jgi:signal transduction histidine kinase
VRRAGDTVEYAVTDTGVGMRPEDIPMALERFRQVDGTHTRKFGGAGLGLPIAKLLTELHGGTLSIASAPGKGTTVTIRLAAAAPSPAAAAPSPEIARAA